MSNVIADSPSAVIAEIVKQLNALVTDVTALRTWANGHTHTGANPVVPTTTDGALTVTAITVSK